MTVHGPAVLAARAAITVRLVECHAFPGGVELHLTVTATGQSAVLARHETRPLTNPADHSAHWSYLRVVARVGDIEGVADPHHPRTFPPAGAGTHYRTDPHYWIGVYPISGLLTLTVGWEQIGLEPVTTPLRLAANPYPPVSPPNKPSG